MVFPVLRVNLGDYGRAVDAALANISSHHIPTQHNANGANGGKANARHLGRIMALADTLRDEGYTHALLLGVGTDSLVTEILREIFMVGDGYLDVGVLDSTIPAAVSDLRRRSDPAETLYIVSSKSGSTIETLSFFKTYYTHVARAANIAHAGDHFIAITNPGSPLAELAKAYEFRHTFLNDPAFDGRRALFSYSTLIPAALMGMDLAEITRHAAEASAAYADGQSAAANPAAQLGVTLAELAKAGRDKLTLLASPVISPFGLWVAHQIARATGRGSTAIVPVVDEPRGFIERYAADRCFVHLRLAGDGTYDEMTQELAQAGHPVVRIDLQRLWDVIPQFRFWEVAATVAGNTLGGRRAQPDAEAATVAGHGMVNPQQESAQRVSREQPTLIDGEMTVYGDIEADNVAEALIRFLSETPAHSYVALQAFLEPTTINHSALRSLAAHIRDRFRYATLCDFGPRYLHSTAPLHKNHAVHGAFIQFTADDKEDVEVPDEAGTPGSTFTFGMLKAAQSDADRQALLQAGGRVLRFHLGQDIQAGLERLKRAIESEYLALPAEVMA